MTSPRVRRLAFELLETKASPSALLLVLAPLDECDQRLIESERAMYAAPTAAAHEDGSPQAASGANEALLKFIEQNTREGGDAAPEWTAPTAAEARAADSMMMVTDTDLRSLLITEMLSVTADDHENVFSVLQY